MEPSVPGFVGGFPRLRGAGRAAQAKAFALMIAYGGFFGAPRHAALSELRSLTERTIGRH